MRCENCGEPEWTKNLGYCALCYLAAGFHLNGVIHKCSKHCPGAPKLAAWKAAAAGW